MRVSSTGIQPDQQLARLTYEGETVEARAGDTVASALVDAGRRTCRQAGPGDGRGLFCGMGVCTECSMVIDGEPGRLACLTPVRDGMTAAVQPPAPVLTEGPHEPLPEQQIICDLLVIGGGPAGLAAAALAAEAGLDVVVVDERGKLGGQYFKQPAESFHLDESKLDTQYRQGRQLIRRAEQAKVRILKGVRVWAAFAPDDILAASTAERYHVRPRRLILATGAYERGIPVPGWTLPGVMTTGAAQTLLRANQVSPGTRVLISGNGPLNLQVAAELARAGVTVVALAELANLTRPGNAWLGAGMLAAAPDLIRDGAGYALALARHRVPVLRRSAVVRLEGDGAVSRATVARIGPDGRAVPGTARVYEVDAVCLGFGFLPSNEIARSLGCRHDYDPSMGALAVRHDSAGRTSVNGVLVVGDSAGITGARVAKAVGTLAGAAVVRDLGRVLPTQLIEEVAAAERARVRNLRFQRALWRVYRAPELTDQLASPDTVVCRCENLTLSHIQAQVSGTASTAGAIKRLTRAGMGKCQGRYCGPVLTALAARQSGRPIDDFAGFAPQVPYKPTEIALIAEPHQPRSDATKERGLRSS